MDVMDLDFFVAGGGLSPDAPSYVKRPADTELYDLCLRGEPGYVLAPPQMGKSSLMIHAAERLQKQQVSAVPIYLSGLSASTGVESWYLGLITRLKFHLKLAVNIESWWQENNSLEVPRRFAHFVREAVLGEIAGPVVIFFDEIESILGQKFAADFLAALRAIYDVRATEPGYRRLNFIILGAALQADLIKDSLHSPFTIARQINLDDFSREEAQTLQRGLLEAYPEQAEAIFSRIYYWTGGQPYLTQKLCLAVAELDGRQWGVQQSDPLVDRLVEKLFLSPGYEVDLNLSALRDSLGHHPQRRRLLALYRQVYEGKTIPDDKQALDQQRLKLLGLVRVEKDSLKVRNMIYRQVFNLNWLKASPAPGGKLTRYLAIGLILAALAVTAWLGLAVYNRFEQVIAAQAQPFLDSFNTTTNPNVRLTSLAGLIHLPGYQEQARRSFFEELNPDEQLALFEVADPHAAGPDLIAVIQGVYTAPDFENDERHNALLQAMTQPLKQLVDDPSTPGAVSLELEITQWLKGRDAYNRGEYRQAVSAYNRAIELNDRNPGTFFDRGLAYAAQGESSLALADFSTVLQLDPNWQPRLQQALTHDSQLYNALWVESGGPEDLIALVPTPTNTPTPTDTPTPTHTPSPTPTPTTRPPTATPTSTATPTPAPVVVSTPLVTPATGPTSIANIPVGTFTLLAPLPSDGPSYGPTHFEWQWSGPLSPEYGFEVRVWRDGQLPTGVHNAVLDNQNGAVKSLGDNKYALDVNIKDAAGILGNSGEYLWTVALVRISPKYRDLAQQAPPGRLLFAAPGGSGGGGKGDGGGGGGVGID